MFIEVIGQQFTPTLCTVSSVKTSSVSEWQCALMRFKLLMHHLTSKITSSNPQPPAPAWLNTTVRMRLCMILKQTCCLEFQTAQYAFKDLMIHGSCDSHYVSHFAAFFIVARAERSIAKSCVFICVSKHIKVQASNVSKIKSSDVINIGWHSHNNLLPHKERREATSKCQSTEKVHRKRLEINNDPSAGSPTETLLRLLLPLNDQVWPSSQSTALSPDRQSIPRSH